jgi:hypothetical protein
MEDTVGASRMMNGAAKQWILLGLPSGSSFDESRRNSSNISSIPGDRSEGGESHYAVFNSVSMPTVLMIS